MPVLQNADVFTLLKLSHFISLVNPGELVPVAANIIFEMLLIDPTNRPTNKPVKKTKNPVLHHVPFESITQCHFTHHPLKNLLVFQALIWQGFIQTLFLVPEFLDVHEDMFLMETKMHFCKTLSIKMLYI